MGKRTISTIRFSSALGGLKGTSSARLKGKKGGEGKELRR